MFYPLLALNLNMLQVQGRSDLFLRLEIIKKALAVPVILIGIFFGIKAMILGMIINTLIAFYINSYWSGRFIGYSLLEQIKDILPSFFLAAGMSILLFFMGILIPLPSLLLLIIQLITGALLFIGLCEGIHFKDYLYLKEIVSDRFLKRYHS
jgi:O-antigen/teichoic acid export membrane protein